MGHAWDTASGSLVVVLLARWPRLTRRGFLGLVVRWTNGLSTRHLGSGRSAPLATRFRLPLLPGDAEFRLTGHDVDRPGIVRVTYVPPAILRGRPTGSRVLRVTYVVERSVQYISLSIVPHFRYSTARPRLLAGVDADYRWRQRDADCRRSWTVSP